MVHMNVKEFSSRNLSICFPVTNAMVCITQTRSHTQVSNHSNNIGTEYMYICKNERSYEKIPYLHVPQVNCETKICVWSQTHLSVHRTCLQNIEFSPCFHHGSLFIITFLFVSLIKNIILASLTLQSLFLQCHWQISPLSLSALKEKQEECCCYMFPEVPHCLSLTRKQRILKMNRLMLEEN